MKKKLIPAAIAALLSSSAALAGGPEMVIMAPSPFDGFYIGGYGSLHQTGFDINGDLNFESNVIIPFNILLATQNGGDNSTDGFGGVHGGWGKVFMRRWYAGIEGFAEFGNANGSITTTTLPNIPFISRTFTNAGRAGTDWGVDGKLGVLLSPTTLAYAKLGAEWVDVKASISTPNNSFFFSNILNSSSSSEQVGFLWGFGVEQFIWRDVVSLFAEYTFVDTGSTNTKATFNFLSLIPFIGAETSSFIGFVANNNVSVSIASFSGGLNLHFRSNWL